MNGHRLYTAADFTVEEINRENTLSVLVIDGGLSICKVCGGGEIELNTPCLIRQGYRPISARRAKYLRKRGETSVQWYQPAYSYIWKPRKI